MATTVSASFSGYAANLEVTDRQTSVLAERRRNVVDCIKAKITLHPSTPSLVVGSYDRYTMIRYLYEADVDVFVVLNYGANKDWIDSSDGAVKALDKVRDVLADQYKTTPLRRDRNAITMRFSEFRLDVVPAFSWDVGGYSIPDSVRKRWIRTDPIKFAQYMTEFNDRHGGKVKPLIKMLKGWNRNTGWPLRSFHLECLVYKKLNGALPFTDYPVAIKEFFVWAESNLWQPCSEPVYGEVVDDYLNEAEFPVDKRATVSGKVADAAKQAKSACQLADSGYARRAIETWKGLLGEFFPSYG